MIHTLFQDIEGLEQRRVSNITDCQAKILCDKSITSRPIDAIELETPTLKFANLFKYFIIINSID